jgi:hypothetical protein
MNNIWFDISGKIDPERVSVLRIIKKIAEELHIPFFIPLPYSLRTLCPGLEIPEGRPQAWVLSLAISIPGIARQGGGDHAQHRHGGAVARMEEDA